MLHMPKRRKQKDNPYTISYNDITNTYTITFADNKRNHHTITVSKEIYNAMNTFELEDISQMHEYERHIEHSEIHENNINSRVKNKKPSLEETFIQNITKKEVRQAVNSLPKLQRQRIKKYYFKNRNEREIAKEEQVSQQAVHKSLQLAKEKLKSILTK